MTFSLSLFWVLLSFCKIFFSKMFQQSIFHTVFETVFLSLILFLLYALKETFHFCHNLTSTEIHLCVTFQFYASFHWSNSRDCILLLCHVSLLRNLPYHLTVVVISGTLRVTHQCAVRLACAILRTKSWSNFILE